MLRSISRAGRIGPSGVQACSATALPLHKEDLNPKPLSRYWMSPKKLLQAAGNRVLAGAQAITCRQGSDAVHNWPSSFLARQP